MKKLVTIMVMMITMIIGAASVNAVCLTEDSRPGIIGTEYIETVNEINELVNNHEIELPYQIEMAHADGYWAVYLDGQYQYEGYDALGFYDHMPNEEDIEILWANRMTEDELRDLCEQYGI